MHAPDYSGGQGLKPDRSRQRSGFLRGRLWWFDVLMLTLFVVGDAYAVYWFAHHGPSPAPIGDGGHSAVLRPVPHIVMPAGVLADNQLCVGGSVVERSKVGDVVQFVQLIDGGSPVRCAGQNRY